MKTWKPTCSAVVVYSNIPSVVAAIQAMDGEVIGSNCVTVNNIKHK